MCYDEKMAHRQSPTEKAKLTPEMVRSDLLFTSSDSRRQAVSPHQVRTLALPAYHSLFAIPEPRPLYGQGLQRIGSEVTVRDINDPAFYVYATSTHEEQRRFLRTTRQYNDKLQANAGKNALVLATYADVLRVREEQATSFQLKLHVTIPNMLYSIPGFAENLEAVSHSGAARNVGLRALSGFERPGSLVTVHSTLMKALVSQPDFLTQVFDEESVNQTMTHLYGTSPDEAQALYHNVFGGMSDAYNAASAIKAALSGK